MTEPLPPHRSTDDFANAAASLAPPPPQYLPIYPEVVGVTVGGGSSAPLTLSDDLGANDDDGSSSSSHHDHLDYSFVGYPEVDAGALPPSSSSSSSSSTITTSTAPSSAFEYSIRPLYASEALSADHHSPSLLLLQPPVRPPSVLNDLHFVRSVIQDHLRKNWLPFQTVSHMLADTFFDFVPAKQCVVTDTTSFAVFKVTRNSLYETRRIVAKKAPNRGTHGKVAPSTIARRGISWTIAVATRRSRRQHIDPATKRDRIRDEQFRPRLRPRCR
ncbi:hypothetical protein DFJ73DRAFT_431921 [Zopfochytrium polystomum]|nr:hypothetical protein DFJ73DRAFT_431921 [Zopfochytrium polystomum]